MPSFWPEGIGNAFPLIKNHCKCLSFSPEGIANAFLFPSNGKFSLTIGMIMPLGWGEVTEIIPKLVTQGPFGFPTRHSWLRHLWLVGNPNGLSWLVWELFFPFTRGKPLVKGKSPCLRLSLKASRHCHSLMLTFKILDACFLDWACFNRKIDGKWFSALIWRWNKEWNTLWD